jgi:hypothetical protein
MNDWGTTGLRGGFWKEGPGTYGEWKNNPLRGKDPARDRPDAKPMKCNVWRGEGNKGFAMTPRIRRQAVIRKTSREGNANEANGTRRGRGNKT